METPSRVFHFIAPYFIAGSDVLAGREFEAVQTYIHSPDILYRHEKVTYADLWDKTSTPSKPDLLHIVAHGADGQLLTADAYLQHLEVGALLFAQDVKAHLGSPLKYIYLGVCDSAALARALAAQGYTVLCFEGKVAPEQGVFFAETFYKFFLQEKRDFYAAYTAAKNSWKSNGYHKNGVTPRFYCTESADVPQFVWDAERYKALLEKLRSAKQPRLLETFFEELNLEKSALEPLNLPEVYRYLKANQALFVFRDRAETFFLENQHAYTEAFMNIEEGLLSAYIESPEPSETKKFTAIAATDLEYKRNLGIGKKNLTPNGLSMLAKKLALPLGPDFDGIKTHLQRQVPVLRVRALPEDAQIPPMNPDKCMAWIAGQQKKFFVLEGAAGSGKTTFLADMMRAHFLHDTNQKVFIARFSSAPALNAQLETWQEDAVGNILILDALDELFDDSNAILGMLTENNHLVRAFSKVVLGFRDTFLKANKPLREAIVREEDWVLLHIAPSIHGGTELLAGVLPSRKTGSIRRGAPLCERRRYPHPQAA
ncbi:MAG: hypothetical protein IPN74_18695 [Haliscomenobacter sp.]|nr:hypothetical protein [Haliscomenobacter sp.]